MLILSIDDRQCTTGGQRLFKKRAEPVFFVAKGIGMLRPDQGIGCDLEEVVEITGAKRPEFDDVAIQNWLIIKRHDEPSVLALLDQV